MWRQASHTGTERPYREPVALPLADVRHQKETKRLLFFVKFTFQAKELPLGRTPNLPLTPL